jgi:hypothetical protein
LWRNHSCDRKSAIDFDSLAAQRERAAQGGNRASNPTALYPSEQQENENNDYDQAHPTGRVVTPTGAIGPSRERANEEQNQDNEEYRSERHNRLHF